MKRPAFQFYGGDWLRDPGLRACSLAARGLWMDMIAIMSQVEEPYGHLVFPIAKDASKDGSKDILTPILPAVLARMVGTSESEVSQCLAELESFGVFSRTPEGIIFSRRMVKDEKLRQTRANGGFQSLKNPNVPKKKDASEDGSKDILKDTFQGSLGGSPAFASASSKNTIVSSKEQQPSEENLRAVYLLYPRRVAPRAALAAMRRALDRIAKSDGTSLFEALVKLRVRVEHYADQERRKGTETKFIPHPATWLNKDCFDNEELLNSTPTKPVIEVQPVFQYRSNAISMEDIRAAAKAGIQ